jgi:hypothetical protein
MPHETLKKIKKKNLHRSGVSIHSQFHLELPSYTNVLRVNSYGRHLDCPLNTRLWLTQLILVLFSSAISSSSIQPTTRQYQRLPLSCYRDRRPAPCARFRDHDRCGWFKLFRGTFGCFLRFCAALGAPRGHPWGTSYSDNSHG